MIFFFFLVDEICDRNSDNCGDVFKVKYVNFYILIQFNIQSVNIFLSVILNDGVEIFIYGLGVYLVGFGEEI